MQQELAFDVLVHDWFERSMLCGWMDLYRGGYTVRSAGQVSSRPRVA